jgi:hypothetical protein
MPLAETVRGHVEAAGCRVVASGEEILLWVHNFEDEQQREARDQEDEADGPARRAAERLLAAAEGASSVLAVADVRYANGADRAFVTAILERTTVGRGTYAGWNTASNALGSAIAQAVAAHHGRRQPTAGTPAAVRRMVAARLLDDWGYQAVVRPRLATLVRERGGDASALGAEAPILEAAARRAFEEFVLPPLAASLGTGVVVRRITFPWDRLFESAIEFDLA